MRLQIFLYEEYLQSNNFWNNFFYPSVEIARVENITL